MVRLLTTVYLNRHGAIRSGWKVLVFLQFIGVVGRTRLGEWINFLPFGTDTVLATLLISVLMLRYFDRLPVRSLGVSLEPSWSRHLIWGAGLGAMVHTVMVVVLLVVGVASLQWSATFEIGSFVAGILTFASVSCFQELLFRGYVFQKLLTGVGRPLAVALTSIAFALYHESAGPVGWLTIGVLGVAMAVSVLRT
ncbi:CPBP family intramembrane glutamic endopeptidase, partial [Candidatus Latescibacterota bacterium]